MPLRLALCYDKISGVPLISLEQVVSSNRPVGIAKNLALAGMLSQIGCATAVIIVAALLGGLWVDSRLNTKPLFTALFLLLSIPVNVYGLVRVALTAAAQFQSEIKNVEKKESEH
jgi:multisubunit Na+/H+ antiporter MnhG subunit